MIYSAPELLLVGAAQNLVLGFSSIVVDKCDGEYEPNNFLYLDDPAW
jgi:hypothetical protein